MARNVITTYAQIHDAYCWLVTPYLFDFIHAFLAPVMCSGSQIGLTWDCFEKPLLPRCLWQLFSTAGLGVAGGGSAHQ